ncbi:ZIP family metal transporter [Romboutsia sp.]|uniref:ZIP family metal transporter n=1 Tax=Romboutsia sp. TaxID=1965302 RepID=UPI002B7B7588|nr:ZIP family metal transporter [Romboutsia sp.]HSQ89914.1 ZIP family metal transporter [Romboutsia sp.]
MEWFMRLSPVIQAFIATLFTWGVTALGAAIVLFFKSVNRKVLDCMLGFGAGVMIAASFWSLLNPAIQLCEEIGVEPAWLGPAMGFLIGGLFIMVSEKLLDKLYFSKRGIDKTGEIAVDSVKRSLLLVTAVTLHNIPEGMAIGVAFGGVVAGVEGATVFSAILLAIGIGLQNFPEGAAVSLPLRREGYSRTKSFLAGQASGMVEPIAGVIGAIAAISMRSILPFLLAFAAGAMISVVCSELIPESTKENKNLATIGVVLGFIVMMIMDVALG